MGNVKRIIDWGFEGELNEKLSSKVTSIEVAKKAKKERKEKLKQERLEEKEEIDEEVKKESLFSKIFTKKEEDTQESEEENKEILLYDGNNNGIWCIPIEKKLLLDNNKKEFTSLSGQSLLRRDLAASPLFVRDEENLLKVLKAEQLYSEKEENEKAFVCLETKYSYYAIEFPVTISF